MRSALYYPFTSVEDEALIKTALLLWDRLEFIVPWQSFRPEYHNRNIQQAMELIGVPHCPTDDEKKNAHKHVEELVSRHLPPHFYINKEGYRPYEIYPEKLMGETWRLLEESQLSGEALESRDYPMTEAGGLTTMSILADCCAGKTRSRVTDRGDAYATLAGFLSSSSGDQQQAGKNSEETLVPITLNIINATSIDTRKLIAFREREEKESGHSLRDLRHRYIDCLEKYVLKLTTTVGNASDADEIKRQFDDDMRIDLANLKREIGFAKREALLSKEILIAALAAVGTVATAAFGVTLPILGAISAAGAPATVGGVLGAGNKYLSARKSILEKHPMAYVYELGRRTK
jgi:hypothetical protein